MPAALNHLGFPLSLHSSIGDTSYGKTTSSKSNKNANKKLSSVGSINTSASNAVIRKKKKAEQRKGTGDNINYDDGSEHINGTSDLNADSNVDVADGIVDFAIDDEDNDDQKMKKKKKSGGFQSLCLCPPLLRAVFALGYNVPTPIQRRAIPILLAGHDLVAMARTGSGKTAAFLIPLIEKLVSKTDTSTTLNSVTNLPNITSTAPMGLSPIRAIVLSPTRELAMQTYSVVQSLTKYLPSEDRFNTALLIGGSSMNQQFEAIDKHPALIIATPGRLMHHLIEVGFSLKYVEYCVFDEADRLFELGFAFQLAEILKKLGPNRQTALFSATLPSQLVEFSRAGLKEAKIVKLDAESKISPLLQMSFFTLRKDQKTAALLYLIRRFPSEEQTIIFTATRHHVDYLHNLLTAASIESTYVYGQLDPAARKINIAKFRSRKVNILIVTDVAARGIDLPLLDNVINYDFTSKPKLFVHRVGRVARAGRSGKAYSLVAPDEIPYMIDLFLFIGRPLLNQPEQKKDDLTKEEDINKLNDTVYYGSLPSNPLSLEEDYIRTLHSSSPHLTTQLAVAQRAYGLYYKTRASASNASAQRQKELLQNIRLHPIFINETDSAEIERERLIESVRGFRSSSTVFELEEHKNAVMKAKRKIHQKIIVKQLLSSSMKANGRHHEQFEERIKEEKENQEDYEEDLMDEKLSKSKKQRVLEKEENTSTQAMSQSHSSSASSSTSSYRDPNFFISPVPSSTKSGLDAEDSFDNSSSSSAALTSLSFDFIGDDTSSLLQSRNVQRWDSRKKKYVTVKEGGDPYRKQRNESGELVKLTDKSKPQLYQKYKKLKQKGSKFNSMNTGDPNEREYRHQKGRKDDEEVEERKYEKGKKGAKRKRKYDDDDRESSSRLGDSSSVKRNKGSGKNELKSADEIRKGRKLKEKNRLKHSSKKGGKGGKGGARAGGGGGKKFSKKR